jgi:hypothetical protein
MASLSKTIIHTCEIDSEYKSQQKTSSCDIGRQDSSKLNNGFFDFNSINDEIPPGSRIDSASLVLAQETYGWSLEIDLDIILCSGSWVSGGFTWNDQPDPTSAGVVNASLSGRTAGTRTFNIKTLIQWLIDNNSSAHIIKFARDPNDTSGSSDAKRFSSTAADHEINITYTPPTAPTMPKKVSLSPSAFEGALRISWEKGTDGTLNPITGHSVRYKASDDGINWGAEIGVSKGAADTYYDIPDDIIDAWARGKYVVARVGSLSEFADPVYSGYCTAVRKNRAPNQPTGASVAKSSYVPGEAIRVSFTNTGDNDGNLTGFEAAMQNASGAWYGSPTIIGTNASASASYVEISTTGWAQGSQWKFFIRGYDSRGVRGAWSAATSLVTMNTVPNVPVIHYPVAGSTVYNRRPRVLLTAGAANDGPKHILKVNDGSEKTTAINGSLFSCGTSDSLSSAQKVVFSPASNYALGSLSLTAAMYDSFLSSASVSRAFSIADFAPPDPVLSTSGMKIRARHITDLRPAINNIRAAYGLPAVNWTPMVAGVTPIGNITIISELQAALQDVISLINIWDITNELFDIFVTWVNPAASGGGVDRVKLRQAIEQLRGLITTI